MTVSLWREHIAPFTFLIGLLALATLVGDYLLHLLALEMSRVVVMLVAASLILIAIFAFTYPRMMVAPGKLISAHQNLNADCFACHSRQPIHCINRFPVAVASAIRRINGRPQHSITPSIFYWIAITAHHA